MSGVSADKVALHSVEIEFVRSGMWPILRFVCSAPEGSECRTVCQNPECEEGCYSPGEQDHARVNVDYCNDVEWFENSDDVAGDIFGGPTSIIAPVLVDWSSGEGGPEWRFAPSSATEAAQS